MINCLLIKSEFEKILSVCVQTVPVKKTHTHTHTRTVKRAWNLQLCVCVTLLPTRSSCRRRRRCCCLTTLDCKREMRSDDHWQW